MSESKNHREITSNTFPEKRTKTKHIHTYQDNQLVPNYLKCIVCCIYINLFIVQVETRSTKIYVRDLIEEKRIMAGPNKLQTTTTTTKKLELKNYIQIDYQVRRAPRMESTARCCH